MLTTVQLNDKVRRNQPEATLQIRFEVRDTDSDMCHCCSIIFATKYCCVCRARGLAGCVAVLAARALRQDLGIGQNGPCTHQDRITTPWRCVTAQL